jgi:hypothetical protein
VFGGNVGIGTTTPTSKLEVAGTIKAQDLTMAVSTWADYVFEPTYALMSVPDLEKFVSANRHLPNIPSQQELQKGGLSVLQMQTKHMEKIEELTRYVIDLYHQNEVLKKENQVIEERLKVLEDLLLKAQKTGDKK